MDIKFPLMSILSVAFLAAFLLLGGTPELHSLEVRFRADSGGVTITVDPAIVVWSDVMIPAFAGGETFGNIAVVHRELRGTDVGNWIKRFETNHILQYRALGWWVYPAAHLGLQIDPMNYNPQHWDDPSEADQAEWLPPDNWIDTWHFLTIIVPST